jgi:hypothetical protein
MMVNKALQIKNRMQKKVSLFPVMTIYFPFKHGFRKVLTSYYKNRRYNLL